ncbi:MAG: putative RDD family membrane protein YckC [Lentimonas sp.]|jgi:uncharacterized RDD family membrane protein YckC
MQEPEKKQPGTKASKDPATQPPPIQTNRLLDSMLSKDGPMPAARLRIRAVAFALDFVLLTAISMLLIWKFIMPIYHPSTFYEFNQWMNAFIAWIQDGSQASGIDMPTMNESLAEGLGFAQDLQLIIFWFYFAIGEVFFVGSSLGKKICRLRSISTVTLSDLPVLTGLVRAGLKTLAIFMLFPLSIVITLCAVLFNKRRQMVHDILSRTAVIDERYKPSQK